MKSELFVLKRLSHNNVIDVYDLLHDEKCYFQIQELAKHGNLFDILESRRIKRGQNCLTEKEAKSVARQLFSALGYLQENNIAHRDIKIENILVHTMKRKTGSDIGIKLSDFGLAT